MVRPKFCNFPFDYIVTSVLSVLQQSFRLSSIVLLSASDHIMYIISVIMFVVLQINLFRVCPLIYIWRNRRSTPIEFPNTYNIIPGGGRAWVWKRRFLDCKKKKKNCSNLYRYRLSWLERFGGRGININMWTNRCRSSILVHMSPYSREHHTAVVAPVSAVSPVIEEFGGNKKDDAAAAGEMPPYHHKYSESGKPTAGYTNGFSLLRRLLRWWLARFGQKPLVKKGTQNIYFKLRYCIIIYLYVLL